jgi:hypothetical protein
MSHFVDKAVSVRVIDKLHNPPTSKERTEL